MVLQVGDSLEVGTSDVMAQEKNLSNTFLSKPRITSGDTKTVDFKGKQLRMSSKVASISYQKKKIYRL